MLDDFKPRRRPVPVSRPNNGQVNDEPEDALPGFRPESVLPGHAGDDLLKNNAASYKVPDGPYKPQAPPTDDPNNPSTSEADSNMPPQQPPMKKKRSKKKKIITAVIILLLLAGAGFAAWWFGFRDTGIANQTSDSTTAQPAPEAPSETKPKSNLVAAPLSGLDVAPDVASRPVTGIMIENSGEARPQSGLLGADIVFEAIAEGGITRFLALFQSQKPDYIGPVRSARPYYVEWATTFNASYAHAGGSPDGLARIKELGTRDINAFAYGDDIFYRTSDRYAPHNLYSSFKGLDTVNQQNGWTTSKFTPWPRKQDVPQNVTAKTVDISISSPFFSVHYDYDPATNTYKRSEGGEVHKDEKTNKQLSPNVVLVMVMNWSQNGIYSVYKTTGSGQFIVFQDGVRSEGTWSRAGATDQYVFKDKYGFEFKLNKGQTWVTVVGSPGDVKSTP